VTNKRASGLAFQRWIRDWLTEKGWTVHNQPPNTKMIKIKGKPVFISRDNDIFNCIDLMCRKPDRMPLNIQATLHTGLGKKIEVLERVPWSLAEDVQIWMKRENGVIDVKQLLSGMGKTVDLGKIIRRKWYAAEGIGFQF